MRHHLRFVPGLALAPTFLLALTLVVGCQNPASDGGSATPAPSAAHWTAGGALPRTGYWNAVAYGNGVFVAVGNTNGDNVATSPDGLTWTSHPMPLGPGDANLAWTAVTFAGGQFVALPTSYESGSTISAVSTDGVHWTTGTLPASMWQSIAYANGTYVAVSRGASGDNEPYVVTSTNGLTWTGVSPAAPENGWSSVAYGNGVFVVSGYGFTRTFDGAQWSEANNLPTELGSNRTSLAFGNGKFVAFADSVGSAATSADGVTWTVATLPEAQMPLGATFGYNTFVAVGGAGNAYTSSDGVTWTSQIMSASKYGWSSVAAGNGRFVAITVFGTETSISR